MTRALRALTAMLAAIDAEREPDSPILRRRALIALLTTALVLFAIHYLKFASVYAATLDQLRGLLPAAAGGSLPMRGDTYFELQGHAWWALWHVIGYALVPMLIIRRVYGARLRDYGLGWGEVHKHWAGYLLLLAPILVFVVLASQRDDFATHYPFYSLAGRSLFDLLAWEGLYLLQFVCLEFFFRGFLLQALRPAFGSLAIWIMCVPYLMIHFPKPWLEALGALPFGFFLGLLALRSRSIWGGVFVHAGVALSMDIAALYQTGRLSLP